jgi:hypothetical protein
MNIDKLPFLTKIGTLIKGATIIQKVGMAAATVAVVGGTTAGIVAANTQITNVEPRPAAAISQPAKTDETTKPEDAKTEETKAEETTTSEDAKPADDAQTSDDSYKIVEEPGRPAKRDWEYTYAEAEEKPAESHDAEPAPAPNQDDSFGGKEKGLQYIILARGDNNVSYFATYGYDGTFSSRDEAMANVMSQLENAGVTNYTLQEDSRMMYGN